jgi:replication factor A1
MIISDGTYFMNTCMPSKRATEALLVTGQVDKNSLIRITEYALKEVNDKKNAGKTTRLVLATSMELLQDAPHEAGRIGDPTDIAKNDQANRRRDTANVAAPGSDLGSAGGGGGAVQQKRRGGGSEYDAISSLNPYRNKWTIKARVTKRGDKKTWSNAKGEGCLFSVDLLDAEGTEIRATFWKEAVDMFYEMLAPGSLATFSGGKLKGANKQWTTIKNEYELTFDRSATINPVEDDDDSIKAIVFEFVKLADVEAAEVKATVDVVGVVKDFMPVSSLTAKSSGRELWKRDVTLVDDSNVAVRLTLWGEEAQKDDAEFSGSPVLCVKGARVGEYQGKNLSSGFGSTILCAASSGCWAFFFGSSLRGIPVRVLGGWGHVILFFRCCCCCCCCC